MILIGSRALAIRAPHLLLRPPKDFDFVSERDEALAFLQRKGIENFSEQDGKIIVQDQMAEFELVKPDTSNQLLIDLVKNDPETIETDFGLVPNVDLLFTIKDAHKYKKNSPHVLKTLVDWHRLKNAGARVRAEYKDFHSLREKESYCYKHPSLTNQSKESFFNAAHGVQYRYEHDSLHEAVKHLEHPAYTYYAKDNDPIKSDKDKFFACEHKIRLYGAIEESSVLALERALIPNFSKWTLKGAWIFAFSKVVTSITSGFFRAWCWENAFEIIKSYPEDYYEKFLKGLEQGIVKPYE